MHSQPRFTTKAHPPWLLALVMLFSLALSTSAASSSSKFHSVIAGIISKLPSYTTWPTNQPSETATLAVWTTSDTTFAAFKKEMDGRQGGGLQWNVVRVQSLAEAAEHRFVFFGRNVEEPPRTWYADLRHRGILTFGESNGSDPQGSIFNFTVIRGKVRFDLDMTFAQAAGMRVDPRIMKLARKVKR